MPPSLPTSFVWLCTRICIIKAFLYLEIAYTRCLCVFILLAGRYAICCFNVQICMLELVIQIQNTIWNTMFLVSFRGTLQIFKVIQYTAWLGLCIISRYISVVSIRWLYNTYRIINFSYTILQMIHFCLNLGYFGQ